MKVSDLATKVRANASKAVIATSMAATTALATVAPVFAEETPAASVLDSTLKASISTGVNNLVATVTDVIGITVPATIVVIGIVVGCRFALKQIKGVLSHAS